MINWTTLQASAAKLVSQSSKYLFYVREQVEITKKLKEIIFFQSTSHSLCLSGLIGWLIHMFTALWMKYNSSVRITWLVLIS